MSGYIWILRVYFFCDFSIGFWRCSEFVILYFSVLLISVKSQHRVFSPHKWPVINFAWRLIIVQVFYFENCVSLYIDKYGTRLKPGAWVYIAVSRANLQILHYFGHGYLQEEKSMIHSFIVTFETTYLTGMATSVPPSQTSSRIKH